MGKGVIGVKTKGRISAGLCADRVRSRFASPLDKATTSEVVWDRVAGLFDEARSLTHPEFVYIVSEGGSAGPVKIGLSAEPIGRLRSMQTGNSRPLRIEYVLLGSRMLEKHLHGIWVNFAIISPKREGRAPAAPGTEWFNPEIRERLLPVAAVALEKQVEGLRESASLSALERTVIEAHLAAGIDVVGDKPRLLRR